ncbi:MAG: DUF5131 family protein [Gemmataceae bacterium]
MPTQSVSHSLCVGSAKTIHFVWQTGAAVKFLSVEPLLGPLPDLDLTGIDWVIVGGESGPGARPLASWVSSPRSRSSSNSGAASARARRATGSPVGPGTRCLT